MRQNLIVHPRTPSTALSGIRVETARATDGPLLLAFEVSGAIGDVRWPPPAAPARRNDLWQRTCFEAFIREADSEAYVEINLSPSGEWAAYAFDGYRSGMRAETSILAPRIEMRKSERAFELRAAIDLGWVLPADRPWRVGLSAVIEEAGGAKSYWALNHPSEKPDFHQSEGFAVELWGW